MVVVMFVFAVSASNVLAQPDQCEGDFDRDQDVDGTSAAIFKQDFGRSPFNNPCPEPPMDFYPVMTKYERMFCEFSADCWNEGYQVTPDFTQDVCCCWDPTITYNYGCRGFEYCEITLRGLCRW